MTPQLIRTGDDTQLWSEVFDEPLSDVFRVQSTVAEGVARGLGVTLQGDERQAVTLRPTTNLAAYEYYLRGNAYFRAGFPIRTELWDAVLSVPTHMSVGLLRADPLWNPLSDNPRFQRLFERYKQ